MPARVTRAPHGAALLLTALLLGPGLAHLLEMPAKMGLSKDEYLLVQQLYRGWALLGIPTLLNLAVVALLTWRLRRAGAPYGLTAAALACLVGAQIVFWVWTYPANTTTAQWTALPLGWEALRAQWEFSHAAGCGLTLAAFCCLAWMEHNPPVRLGTGRLRDREGLERGL